jgi:hypothetical protein
MISFLLWSFMTTALSPSITAHRCCDMPQSAGKPSSASRAVTFAFRLRRARALAGRTADHQPAAGQRFSQPTHDLSFTECRATTNFPYYPNVNFDARRSLGRNIY